MISPASASSRQCAKLLGIAGIEINGDRPWDITVHDERCFGRIVKNGLVGLGETYADGLWDCDALDQMMTRCLRVDLPARLRFARPVVARFFREHVFNLQTTRGAWRNGESHYNLGNDLFENMLDHRLTYSCAYWNAARTLDEAQEHKLELICRKLGLQKGMRVLDIGSGWGCFVGYAAERFGCEMVGVTVSQQQAEYSRRRYEGLPIEIRLMDYRSLDERFDRVVSIGMFEHVGPKNYQTFMRVVDRCLAHDGLALLHFIATQRPWPNRLDSEMHWLAKHIFPGGAIPSLGQVGTALDGRFVTEDLHNFGADYDRTLMAWYANFEHNWPALRKTYDEHFHRVWKYYLLTCAGAFRSRKYQVWQFVLSSSGVPGGYHASRQFPFITGRPDTRRPEIPVLTAQIPSTSRRRAKT